MISTDGKNDENEMVWIYRADAVAVTFQSACDLTLALVLHGQIVLAPLY